MSVQANTYIVLGAKFDYSQIKGNGDFENMLEPYMDSAFEPREDGMVCLYDNMNGDYIILGHVLAVSEEGQHLAEPVCIEPPSPECKASIAGEITAILPLGCPEIKTWVVSHYR